MIYSENSVNNGSKSSWRSANRIQRQMHTLMRRKKEASDGLKTVKSVAKCLFLRKKLHNAEAELKQMFDERKFNKEDIAIAKIKRNPKIFLSLAKKKEEKKFGGIGPFLNENEDPIEESAAEALRKIYEKA